MFNFPDKWFVSLNISLLWWFDKWFQRVIHRFIIQLY